MEVVNRVSGFQNCQNFLDDIVESTKPPIENSKPIKSEYIYNSFSRFRQCHYDDMANEDSECAHQVVRYNQSPVLSIQRDK